MTTWTVSEAEAQEAFADDPRTCVWHPAEIVEAGVCPGCERGDPIGPEDPPEPPVCAWCGYDDCDHAKRIACDVPGQPGHHYCGICPEHDLPRFACGCGLFGTEVRRPDEPWGGR